MEFGSYCSGLRVLGDYSIQYTSDLQPLASLEIITAKSLANCCQTTANSHLILVPYH